jgi:hypothetical protein
MGIGFDETSMTGVMRHQIAGDLIMDGDPGYDDGRRVWARRRAAGPSTARGPVSASPRSSGATTRRTSSG